MMSTQVALLRGVNVGGKNRLPMKDLVEFFVAAGCGDVRTYIQSGNVLFTATPDIAAVLPGVIEARVAERFGYRTPVIVRTAAEVADVIAGNPCLAWGVPEESLHVLFLADRPAADRVAALDSARSPGDLFVVRGRAIYLQLPNGAGRSKLTNNWFERTLATVGTARNWRTVAALWGLMIR